MFETSRHIIDRAKSHATDEATRALIDSLLALIEELETEARDVRQQMKVLYSRVPDPNQHDGG